jgi:hypothetical protein
LSATNEIYQKCPLCSETFSKHELKSVKFNATNMPKIEKNGNFLYIEKNDNNFENEKNSKNLKNEKNGNIKKNRKDRGNSVGSHTNDKLSNDNSISEFVGNDSNIDHNDNNNDTNTKNHRKNDHDNEYTVQLLFIEKESLCPYLPSNKKNNSNTNKNLKNKKINSNIVMNNNIVPLINSVNGKDKWHYQYHC